MTKFIISLLATLSLILIACSARATPSPSPTPLPKERGVAPEVWVTNMQSANVQVIDPATNKVVVTIPTDKGAHNVTFSPDRKLAFVANVEAANVSIIDAVKKEVIATVPAGTRAHHVAVSPDGRTAVVSNPGSGDVTFVDVVRNHVTHTLPTGKGAMMAFFSPDGKQVFVANAGDANVAVVDTVTSRVLKTIPAGKGVMAHEPMQGFKLGWSTGPDEDKVIVFDILAGEQVGVIAVPGEPHGLVLSPDEKVVYVVQRKLNQLAVIDVASRQITKTSSPMGERIDMVAVSPDGKTLYVTSRNENNLLVVAAQDLKIIVKIPTGNEPHGVAYRP